MSGSVWVKKRFNSLARLIYSDSGSILGDVYKRQVITWTTDGFYRETKEKVAYRKQEGCEVVEMECAALAACASLRNAVWGCILFTADTLADVENYDERNWGGDSFAYALELCLDAVVNI